MFDVRKKLSVQPRPGRDVLIAVALKCLLLWAIYCLFFAPSHLPRSDAASTAAALIGTGTRSPQ